METNENAQRNTFNLEVPSKKEIAAKRSFIPLSFGAVILLFFFTFCDLKCTNGQHVASVKGINLVTGTTFEKPTGANDSIFGPTETGEKEKQRIKPSFWAIIAFLSAIGGLFVFFKRHPKEDFMGAAAGGVGTASLLFLWFNLSSKSSQLASMQMMLIIRPAFWLAFLAFTVAGGISYLRYRLPMKTINKSLDAEELRDGIQEES